MPIGEGRQTSRDPDVQYTPDDDYMGMPFDRLLDLAVDGGESIGKQRHTGYSRDPSRGGKTISALEAIFASKSLGDIKLIRGQYVNAEEAVALH